MIFFILRRNDREIVGVLLLDANEPKDVVVAAFVHLNSFVLPPSRLFQKGIVSSGCLTLVVAVCRCLLSPRAFVCGPCFH